MYSFFKYGECRDSAELGSSVSLNCEKENDPPCFEYKKKLGTHFNYRFIQTRNLVMTLYSTFKPFLKSFMLAAFGT